MHSAVEFQPGKPWRLWDMINFMLPEYAAIQKVIAQEIDFANARLGAGNEIIDGVQKDRIRKNMSLPLKKARQYGLETVENRIERVLQLTKEGSFASFSDVARNMIALWEALEDDTRFLYLYAYPKDRVRAFINFQSEWSGALRSFGSATKMIESATDLYALGHNNGCVFHLMQVLERGLKALAADVSEDFNTQQWEEIIGTIEGRIKTIQKNGIPGATKAIKDDRLQFLSEAAKEFRYFKDGWRNYVSHGRADYDECDARSVLVHVRDFMNHLSSRLCEEG